RADREQRAGERLQRRDLWRRPLRCAPRRRGGAHEAAGDRCSAERRARRTRCVVVRRADAARRAGRVRRHRQCEERRAPGPAHPETRRAGGLTLCASASATTHTVTPPGALSCSAVFASNGIRAWTVTRTRTPLRTR